VHQLVAKGKVTRGVSWSLAQDVDEALAKALNLKDTEGSLVGDVTAGGPADKAVSSAVMLSPALNGKKVDTASFEETGRRSQARKH